MRRSTEGSSEEGSSKEDGSPKSKSKGILTPEPIRKSERPHIEKRVSFDTKSVPILRTQSLMESRSQTQVPNKLPAHHQAHQEDHSDLSEEASAVQHAIHHEPREATSPVETCDIEPFSGTVFRKMMVRRRRQNEKKIGRRSVSC